MKTMMEEFLQVKYISLYYKDNITKWIVLYKNILRELQSV